MPSVRRFLLFALLLLPLLANAASLAFRLERLPPDLPASEAAVRSGALDGRFLPSDTEAIRDLDGNTWFRLIPESDWSDPVPPVLVVRQTRGQVLTVFPGADAAPTTLGSLRTDYPAHLTRGLMIFPLPAQLHAGEAIYMRAVRDGEATKMRPLLSIEKRDDALAASLTHARIAMATFGALLTLALGGICIWLILHESLFLVFAGVVGCQAFYVALVFGEGLTGSGMNLLLPYAGRITNAFAGLGALVATVFARRMVDLERIAPRLDRAFGYLQRAYVATLIAVPLIPGSAMGALVVVGNLTVMIGTAMVLTAGFLGWRRGSRAAAFFLLAWMTMQGFTFARAASFLFAFETGPFLYYGFPLSMVFSGVMLGLGLADRMAELRVELREAQHRAHIDPLTGVLSRRSILERLDLARIRFRDSAEPVSVLFVDLDHFKRINDSFGHLAGDACLREASRRIGAVLRRSDALGRYGGEEFLIVLQGAEQRIAVAIAEQIRSEVAALPVLSAGEEIALSCSVGVASSSGDAVSAEDLIARADAALYAAKRDGRNRVALAPESSLVAPTLLLSQGETRV